MREGQAGCRDRSLVAVGPAAALSTLVLGAGRATSIGGTILLVAYAVLVFAFYLAGDR
jgi:Ca2+/H+ antiporter